jgi:GH15 family glucan-1,4-alpha-glucosidase
VLRQHYETDALDASTLLAAMFGFLPATTSACAGRSRPIARDLTEDGFVLRLQDRRDDDGLSGKEGSFLICSFWLVSAAGDHRRPAERARPDGAPAQRGSPSGLYAEEFDTAPAGHLGNFPQPSSHLALIEAAARIILAERLAEIST